MKKKFISVLAVTVTVLCLAVFASAASPVTVTLNGEKIDCASYGQEAEIVEGRTLVPLRAIFEALGASVEWNGETKTVTSVLDETEIKLTIGEKALYKNGETVELDVPAQIMNGRTMVPVRAISESFGVKVEWDGETRTVILTFTQNKYDESMHAYGVFYFGMTKDDIISRLGETDYEEDENLIKVTSEEKDGMADSEITAEAKISGIDFVFRNDVLVKIFVVTENLTQEENESVITQITEHFGVEPQIKKDGDEYIWNPEKSEIEATATVYHLNVSVQNYTEYDRYIELEIQYTGTLLDSENTETEEPSEEEEKDYLYGKMYFGMGWDELEEAVEMLSFRFDGKFIVEINNCYFSVEDKDGTNNDEDESITGKTNVNRLTFCFEEQTLNGLEIETDPMTYEETEYVVDALSAKYGEPIIKLENLDTYEWLCDDKIVILNVHDENKNDEKAHHVVINFKNGKFFRNKKVNILDHIPIGINHEKAIKYFSGSRKNVGENSIEFYDIDDPSIIMPSVTEVSGTKYSVGVVSYTDHYMKNYESYSPSFYYMDSYGRLIYLDNKPKRKYQVDYQEDDDIFGQEFECSSISLALVDDVYDNCCVKTKETTLMSAANTMNYVAKYFGLDEAVFDEDNLRYEWKNYNFPSKRDGIEKVDIYAGIAEESSNKYYCYVSVGIAKKGRYHFVEDSGKMYEVDYPHAYGNLYFGTTMEQALEVIKGENKVSDDACRIDVYDKENDFDDEDKNITGDINFESMSVLFDSEKKTLYKVSGVSSAVTSEQVQNVLKSLREYYGNEDDVKETSGVTSYSWAVRGKNSNVCFDVAESGDGFVCTYAVTFAGIR